MFVSAAVPKPAPPASGGFSIPVGRTLSRLGNVTMRVSFTRTTGFSRFTGATSVPYRLGLVRDPDTQWNGDEVQSIYRGPQATTRFRLPRTTRPRKLTSSGTNANELLSRILVPRGFANADLGSGRVDDKPNKFFGHSTARSRSVGSAESLVVFTD